MKNIKLASIDVGLKRVGVAICVASNLVTPQSPILRKNRNQAAREVDEFLTNWEVDILVVGLPKSNEVMQRRINHFVKLLEFNGEIQFQNEDMSSVEAGELMRGDIKYKRDGRIDSLAAKIILERYLIDSPQQQ